jgi:DNA-binding XRE family transcriptional regulator
VDHSTAKAYLDLADAADRIECGLRAMRHAALSLRDAMLAHREAAGYSQEELAERAGLHHNLIGLQERGEQAPNLLTF